MRFHFYKMHGCGNDFLVLDYMKEEDPVPMKKLEVEYLCDRNFGVGADGLVILSKSMHAAAKWRFYNSDGSSAEMCGNAARCAIRFLSDHYFPEEELLSIETDVGIIKGKKLDNDGLTEITLMPGGGDNQLEPIEHTLRFNDDALRVYSINTGVPHAVIEVPDIKAYPILEVRKFLRSHSVFGAGGTNVTYYQKLVGQQLLSTTFERGVEGETFACGTGAAAAAVVYAQLYMQPLPVVVTVPGGELTVDMSPVARRLLLRGPAEYVTEVLMEDLYQGYEKRNLFSKRELVDET